MIKIVVVGNGMVGYKFCEKFTQQLADNNLQDKYEIVVFCEEEIPAYDRVHLSEYIADKSAEDLTLASIQWYKQWNIDIRINESVIAIDKDSRLVYSSKGLQLNYDKLILATGSEPFVPPIEGGDKKGIFVYRTLKDLDQIRMYSKHAKRCAVIGGGLLGLEAAKASQDLGMKTFVVEFADRLMPRQLDNRGGKILKKMIELNNIEVLLSKQTKAFEGGEKSR